MHNVDNTEIEKFNSIASSWWDLEGDFKPLHMLNPVRLDYISQKLDGLINKSIVDVGCGGGILAESMAKKGATVTGIDLASDSINVAKLHALEQQVPTVNYQLISAEKFSEQNPEQFDAVTCMEMLEHVPDPESIIASVSLMLKPGGIAFFSTLNKTIKSYLLAIVAAERLLKLVPKGTHEFDKFIKPAQLIDMAERHGLKVRDCIGLHYNPISEQFSLKPDSSVNYILYCEKL